jgi:hypothetical protein
MNHEYLKKIDLTFSNDCKECNFGEEELFVINEILKKSKVETIIISGVYSFFLDGLKVLVILKDTLMNHRYIKNIDLSCNFKIKKGNFFEDKGCLFINDILKNPRIEEIDLSGNIIFFYNNISKYNYKIGIRNY